MSINAKFVADFSSFSDAVKKAEVELRSFETGAGKVEKALSRMTDNFSGRRLIQDATLMTKAIENVGGISKLTASELEAIGSKAAEAADKMRRLGIEVPPGLRELAKSAKGAEQDTSSLGVSFGKLVASMVTAEAIISGVKTAFGALVGGIETSIKAAGEAEKAHAQMAAALRAQGTAIPSVMTAYQGYASALEKTTIFQDDALEGAEALLTQIGNVMPRDMEKALAATTELASGLGIDLTSAATLVAKAAEGTTTGLRKLGVETTDAHGKALAFGKVLDSITDKFGGQAAAVAGTYQGRLEQLGNTWNNVEESIGRVITQNQTLLSAFDVLNKAITENTGELASIHLATNLVSDAVILLVRGIAISGVALAGFADSAAQTVVELTLLERFMLQSAETALLFAKAINLNDPILQTLADVGMAKVAQRAKDIEASLLQAGATAVNASKFFNNLSDKADALAAELGKTRGHTVALKDATNQSTDAWTRQTKAITDGKKAAADVATALKEEADAWDFLQKKQDETMKETVASMQAMNKGQPDFMKKWLLMQHHALQAEGKDLIDRITLFGSQARAAFVAGAGQKPADLSFVDWEAVNKVSKASLQYQAETARATYEYMKAHAADFTQATIAQFKDLANQANRALGGIGANFKGVLKDSLGGLNSIFQSAFEGGGGVKGAVQSFATNALSGILGAIPVVGPVISKFAGAIVAGFKKIFSGPSKEELASRDAQAKFIEQLNGIATAQEKAAIATYSGSKAYATLAIVGRDALLGVGKSAEYAAQVVKNLLDTKNPQNFAAAMREVQDALNLQKQAQDALNEALSRYKFTTEELGPALAAQKLSEQSQQLYKDWEVLTKSGVNIAAVGREMQASVNDFIQTGLKTKTEVDPALKPMLQSMIDLGLLTDAAGNKFGSLDEAGITFASTMSDVVDAVKELTDVLRRGLGLAIDETVAKISDIPRSIDIGVNYNSGNAPEPPRALQATASRGGIVTPIGIQAFARGGTVKMPEYLARGTVLPFVPKGTDTVPAMLTPGETVRTKAQEAALQQGNQAQSAEEIKKLHGELQALRADMARRDRLLPKALRDALLLAS